MRSPPACNSRLAPRIPQHGSPTPADPCSSAVGSRLPRIASVGTAHDPGGYGYLLVAQFMLCTFALYASDAGRSTGARAVFAHVRRLGLVMWPPRRAGTEMRPGSRPSDGSMVNPDWAGHLILSIPPRGAHGGRAENAIYIVFCVTGWVRIRDSRVIRWLLAAARFGFSKAGASCHGRQGGGTGCPSIQ